MPLNFEILSPLEGKLKALTLIVGVICLGLTADTFNDKESGEEFFLAMVIICWIISFLWFVVLILGVISENKILTMIDMVYHAIGGLLLFISMITWFVSVNKYGKAIGNGRYITRIFAGIFGLINIPLYLLIGFLLLRRTGMIG